MLNTALRTIVFSLLIAVLFPAGTSKALEVACEPAQNCVHNTCSPCLGKVCSTLGSTVMDFGQENLIACLKDEYGQNRWRAMAPVKPTYKVKTTVMPFTTTTAQYLDCPAEFTAIACTSVVVPSGSFSCQIKPGINPTTKASSCVQAGCSSHGPNDTGYYSTGTCVKH